MNESFVTIYLLAAIQGVLLSAFLFTKRGNHTANLVLSVATLALSCELASVVYYTNGWYSTYPHAMGITYPFPLLYGPLFFLYARLVSRKVERLQASDLLHFIPFVAAYGITAPVFFCSGEEKIAFLNSMFHGTGDPIYSIAGGIVAIQGMTYTILTIRSVAEYNRIIRDRYSNIDVINLNWLKYLTLGLTIIWSIVAFLTLARLFRTPLAQMNALLNIPLALLIYAIGYMGLKQPEIFLEPSEPLVQRQSGGKYRRSGLSEGTAAEIKRRLLALMVSEKPFLDQNLTLQGLAKMLDVSGHNLSEVINSQLQQSYFDFINQNRVEEFKRRLADPANENYSLLGLAFDSGFASKGTFNSVFKKLTGTTPSAYKSSLANSAHKESST